jgi:hypothetical protein
LTPELDERADILVAWIRHNPEVVLRPELLAKGLRLELEAAYSLGRVHSAQAATSGVSPL